MSANTPRYDLDTDITLGGNNPSDQAAVSQKAVKYYIDHSSGGIVIDNELSTTSENPVQNRIITDALNTKQDVLTAGTDLEIVEGTVINFTNASGYTKNVGTVTSVNNIQPDSNGNVTIPTGGTVDQTYDGTSTNAQSGVAIAGELVNYMPLNSSSNIDIYANSINFDLGDKLTLNSAPVLCQGWNSLSDNVDGFGINIDTDGLWYSWNYNHNFYVDYESSSMYGYEYGSNNTVSHKHGITVYGNGINFSNLNYETTITIPSDGSLALNGHNIITDNNLKTINNQSIIGSGNINISGGTTYTEGNGIDITNDTISIDTSVVATQTDISDMATQTWVGNQGYLTSSALTNYVTTNTAQDISGRKTFLGEKAIYFKQQATWNKLGFTLYDPNNVELGALECRPNTIGSASLLALNCPQTTGGYVGFRYWGTPAVNIVAPKVATAGNYFMATHITNGSTTVTANNQGTVNISTLLPDVSNFVTNTSLATTLADYQPLLVSGTNIKTVNNISLLGSGNITIDSLPSQSGQSGKFLTTNGTTASWSTVSIPTVDQIFDSTSTNAQSGVAIGNELANYVNGRNGNIEISNDAVLADITYSYIDNDTLQEQYSVQVGATRMGHGTLIGAKDYTDSENLKEFSVAVVPKGFGISDSNQNVLLNISNNNLTVNGTEVALTTDIPDISTKQDTLVSGTNIKTINNTSILGSGNIDIQGGASMTYDSTTETLIFS